MKSHNFNWLRPPASYERGVDRYVLSASVIIDLEDKRSKRMDNLARVLEAQFQEYYEDMAKDIITFLRGLK